MSNTPDCIIIGGGIVGLSIARILAQDDFKVTLLEREVCGGEASWAGAGVITPFHPNRLDTLAQLRNRSLQLYPEWCASLQEQTGIDPQYENCGELELLYTEESLNIARANARISRERCGDQKTPDFIFHTPEETAQIEPAVSRDILGAMEYCQTAQIRNPRLLRALKTSCEQLGVNICEQSPVVDFIMEADRVCGVKTENDSFHADRVILCAGAWSSQITTALQESMPVHPVRGQIVLMKLENRPFHRILSRGKCYLVPRQDGFVLLGSTEEPEAGFTKRNTAKGVNGLIETALQLSPCLENALIESTWSGLRPGTPDDKPYFGPVPHMQGLIAATGHYRSGLILAPVTADIVGAMIQNQPYDIDLSCCMPGRYAEKVTP